MNINKLICLVVNCLPGKINNLETYEDAIRFDYGGSRFRVSLDLFVEEVKDSLLISSTAAGLMAALLKVSVHA